MSSVTPASTIFGAIAELYQDVVGQDRVVAILARAATRPVHAYLFVGPSGTGKAAAATSFAAALLCPTAGVHREGPLCEGCRRVLAGVHPDVMHVEREGASIGIEAAREVTRTAFMSPVEAGRKVVILHDFHLVRDTGPALLKTIEEPPATTVFVVLAEYLPPELQTIASRCVTLEFSPLSPAEVVGALTAAGVERDRAVELAEAAGGRLDRARLLAADPRFEERRRTWHSIPARLDGTGATAAAIVDQLIGLLDASVEPLQARQAEELTALQERNQRAAEVQSSGRGSKGAGRARAARSALGAGVKELEERHRREIRRQRTDELRLGLSTLASAYRARLSAAPDHRRRRAAVEAIGQVDQCVRSLEYNPGEQLVLQALFCRLGRIAVESGP